MACEEEYKPAAQEDGKRELADAALVATVASVKSGTQWAIVGDKPERKYVDFQKAMQSGAMSNLQMGGHVTDDLHAAFSALASAHRGLLTSSIAEVSRVYDAGLDKTFCTVDAGACSGSGGAKKAVAAEREDEEEDEEEIEKVEL